MMCPTKPHGEHRGCSREALAVRPLKPATSHAGDPLVAGYDL